MLGTRIKEARKASGHSQEAFSKLLGISKRSLIHYEKGESEPTISVAKNIAKICTIDLTWLLTGEAINPKEETGLVEIPYFEEVYAAAGAGAINYTTAPKPMAFSTDFLTTLLGVHSFKNLHIINSIGNSMEPTIKEGEYLFVNPLENESNNLMDGGIYVISTPDGILVKRIHLNPFNGSFTLISDNKSVPAIEISANELDSCSIIGRVLGHFDKIA